MEIHNTAVTTNDPEIETNIHFTTQQKTTEQTQIPASRPICRDFQSTTAVQHVVQSVMYDQTEALAISTPQSVDGTVEKLPQLKELDQVHPQMLHSEFIQQQIDSQPSISWFQLLRSPKLLLKSLAQPFLRPNIIVATPLEDDAKLSHVEPSNEAHDNFDHENIARIWLIPGTQSLCTIAVDQQSIASQDSSVPNKWCIDVTVEGKVDVLTRFDTQSDSHFVTRPALNRMIEAGIKAKITPIPSRKIHKYETPLHRSAFVPQYEVVLWSENRRIGLEKIVRLKILEETDADQIIIGHQLLTTSFLNRIEKANAMSSPPTDGTAILATLVKGKRSKSKYFDNSILLLQHKRELTEQTTEETKAAAAKDKEKREQDRESWVLVQELKNKRPHTPPQSAWTGLEPQFVKEPQAMSMSDARSSSHSTHQIPPPSYPLKQPGLYQGMLHRPELGDQRPEAQSYYTASENLYSAHTSEVAERHSQRSRTASSQYTHYTQYSFSQRTASSRSSAPSFITESKSSSRTSTWDDDDFE
jgi:hypothetical protein